MTTKRELRKSMDLSIIDKGMKKVVLLLRVSTNSQDYEYQRNTLTDICKRNGWEVVHTVENKVSGAKKARSEKRLSSYLIMSKTMMLILLWQLRLAD